MSGMRPGGPKIWFEIEDLLRHGDAFAHPTGIQRVTIEMLFAAWQAFPGRVGLCRLNRRTDRLETLAFPSLLAALDGGKVPRHGVYALRVKRLPSDEWIRTLRDRFGGRRRARSFAASVSRGDILVCVGSPWPNERYAATIAAVKRRHGLRFALLIHDLIAITQAELFGEGHVRVFSQWVDDMLPLCDLVLTSSQHVRGELAAYAGRRGLAAPRIGVIRFGSGFAGWRDREAPCGVAPALPGRFVLLVSTIEVRKNHRLMVNVWRRLLERHGADAIPPLVFAGRIGWHVEALMADLAASRWLDGKIILLREPSDAALGEAYRRCLFTVYPSRCEGWGLPLAESLAHGRPCVSSNATSLPEVGGDLVDYFDPADEDAALAAIERVLFEPGYLETRTKRIETEFRPTEWRDTVAGLIGHVDALAGGRPL